VATATTRSPSGKSLSNVLCVPLGEGRAPGEDDLGDGPGGGAAARRPGRFRGVGVVAGEIFRGNIAAQIGGRHVRATSILTRPTADRTCMSLALFAGTGRMSSGLADLGVLDVTVELTAA
jgi:hypothetical protein